MIQSNVQIAYASTKDSTESAAKTLVQNWSTDLTAAEHTVKATTQRVLRTVAHASLLCRIRTNDRQLRYRRINTEMFIDTAESTVRFKRGNIIYRYTVFPFDGLELSLWLRSHVPMGPYLSSLREMGFPPPW